VSQVSDARALEAAGVTAEAANELSTVLHMWRRNCLRPAVVTLLGSSDARACYRCVCV
jgi:hypothetical protein